MSRFSKVVHDYERKLKWSHTINEMMNWEQANKYCIENGCRLPTISELQSIVNYDKANPATYDEFKDDTKLDEWYWTGKRRVGKEGEAFCVSFVGGCCNAQDIDGYKYFRMVSDL